MSEEELQVVYQPVPPDWEKHPAPPEGSYLASREVHVGPWVAVTGEQTNE